MNPCRASTRPMCLRLVQSLKKLEPISVMDDSGERSNLDNAVQAYKNPGGITAIL